ncbi:MAG TPA: YceI family protein [Acidimicrobiales bacterium]|nr:YceI family protein [Acidimicrobiales bacterium]
MTDSPPGPSANFDGLLNSGFGQGAWKLDPVTTAVTFAVKHLWGAITVHGSFGEFAGDGAVGDGGTISGRLVIKASSLSTKNKKRDTHLRSKDFFDVEHHGEIVVAVHAAKPMSPLSLKCTGTLEAAGYVEPIAFTATVEGLSAQSVTLRAELIVDRSKFGMTWSPLHMSSMVAKANVVARFVPA